MDGDDIKSIIDDGVIKVLQNKQLTRTKTLLRRTHYLPHTFDPDKDPRVIPTLSKWKVASDVSLLNPRSFRSLSQELDSTQGKQHSSSLNSIPQTSEYRRYK